MQHTPGMLKIGRLGRFDLCPLGDIAVYRTRISLIGAQAVSVFGAAGLC